LLIISYREHLLNKTIRPILKITRAVISKKYMLTIAFRKTVN